MIKLRLFISRRNITEVMPCLLEAHEVDVFVDLDFMVRVVSVIFLLPSFCSRVVIFPFAINVLSLFLFSLLRQNIDTESYRRKALF